VKSFFDAANPEPAPLDRGQVCTAAGQHYFDAGAGQLSAEGAADSAGASDREPHCASSGSP
jgi:hypothetical protein